MKKLRCKRCQHEWWPRSDKEPQLCPACKSRKWDQKIKLKTEESEYWLKGVKSTFKKEGEDGKRRNR